MMVVNERNSRERPVSQCEMCLVGFPRFHTERQQSLPVTLWRDCPGNSFRNVREMKLREAAAAVLSYETDKGQSTCTNPAAECLSP